MVILSVITATCGDLEADSTREIGLFSILERSVSAFSVFRVTVNFSLPFVYVLSLMADLT